MDPFEVHFSDNSLSDQFLEKHYLNSAELSPSSYELPHISSGIPGPFRCPKRRGRPVANNAARERSRVKTLRTAFLDLQRTLPAVPPDTKLSKLDVLVLATTYIAHLMSALHDGLDVSQIFAANGCMHPVKKWPMRTRLYAGILSSTGPQRLCQEESRGPCANTEAAQAPWMQGSRAFR